MKTALITALALAAAFTAGPAVAQAPPPAPGMAPSPDIPPAERLEGRPLLEALRRGGYNLYVRHAKQVTHPVEQCNKPSLTELGEAQARQLGGSLRRLTIPVGMVKASPTCRTLDTARLMAFRPLVVTDDLLPGATRKVEGQDVAVRFVLLAEMPASGMNTLLVSHGQASANPSELMQLELAEVIVYKPDGHGGARPVARIRLEDWALLGSLS